MGTQKKRAREGNTPRRLCPADSFLFDRTVVMDNSSLEKLLRITITKKKRNNNSNHPLTILSCSYSSFAVVRVSISANLNFFRLSFCNCTSCVHLNCDDLLCIYFCIINSSLLNSTRVMGTSFRHNDFWDRFGGQVLVMIGRWYSRQPLTNHK